MFLAKGVHMRSAADVSSPTSPTHQDILRTSWVVLESLRIQFPTAISTYKQRTLLYGYGTIKMNMLQLPGDKMQLAQHVTLVAYQPVNWL